MAETASAIPKAPEARDLPNAPADWSVQFVQCLMRAAGRSERTIELSRQILERASRGHLPPGALQDSIAVFARGRNEAYARELATLGTRFLAGLVLTSVDNHQRVPPSFESADPIGWFQQIAHRAAELNAAAVDAFHAQLNRAAAGETLARAALAQGRLPEYLNHVARLSFDMLNELTELRARYEEDCLRQVLAAADGWNAVAPLALYLVAPLGDVASTWISLENGRSERTTIRCAVPQIRRANGVGPAFDPHVAVVPDSFIIEPGEEARVQLSVRLDDAAFESDAPCIGTLQVMRHGEARLDVPLQIVATSPVDPTHARKGLP